MAMNPLPPQAYTRETLQKAYQWLLTQNASIKELASNQDLLVGLYLKAQRNGEASLEAPSIQNFKQELKSLANMMGDFQEPVMVVPPNNSGTHSSGTGAPAARTTSSTASYPPSNSPSSSLNASPSHVLASKNSVNVTNSLSDLDQHSLLIIQEVKATLNLGSDTEALRALISLGHRQFKKLNS